MAIDKTKIQDLLMNDPTSSGKDAVIMTALSDIEEVANDIQNSVRDIDFRDVDFVKGEKGDKGDKGEQGIQGEKGEKGDIGEQGIQGERGIQGEKGKDGLNADEEYIVNKVLELIPEQEEIIFDNAEQLRDKLEALKGDERLDMSAIAGLDKVIKELKKDIKKGGKTLFGGGVAKQGYQISLDTTNFNNNLDSSVNTVQKLADAVDDLAGSGGSSTFSGLNDTPADYTGQAGKVATVKSDESGLEFTDKAASGGGDMLKSTYDTDDNGVVDNSEKLENQTGSYYLDRTNHTGTQTVSTISDFDTEVSNNTDVSNNTNSRHDAVTVTDSAEIDFTLTGQDITASIKSGSIDESKLDTSVNDSLDKADSAMQDLSGNDTDDLAEGTTNLYYPSADKTKLAGIEYNAEVNNISDTNATDLTDNGDSTLHYHSTDRDRTNHTGTQTASTISDFDTEVSNNTDVSDNTTARHTHSNKTVLDNTEESFLTTQKDKLDNISVTQAVDLDQIESDTNTNNAKETNATHTGEVTGDSALTIADNVITNAKMADDAVGIAELSATGTADATTYLRGDNTWATVSGGGSSLMPPVVVYKDTDTNINSAETKINFNIVVTDADSNYDTGTYKFTAPVDGVYKISNQARWHRNSSNSHEKVRFNFYINGSYQSYQYCQFFADEYTGPRIHEYTTTLTAGDEVEMYYKTYRDETFYDGEFGTALTITQLA